MKRSDSGRNRSVMGRAVIHHSPDKHPEQSDPMAPQPRLLSRLDIAGFDRNRPSAAGAEPIGQREPQMTYTDGGPVQNAGGSEALNTAKFKRGRLASMGKRGWKK